MGRLLPFLVLADIALTAMAVFDCATTEPARIRHLSKRVWFVVIVLGSPIGGIAWFRTGRTPAQAETIGIDRSDYLDDDKPAAKEPTPEPSTRRPPPDDDPEFLHQLEIMLREQRRINKDQPPAPPGDE